jgi:hypothetical protein
MIYKTKILIKGFDELICAAICEWLGVQNNFIIKSDDDGFEPDLQILFYNSLKPEVLQINIPSILVFKGAIPPKVEANKDICAISMPFRFAELEAAIYNLIRAREASKMAALKLNGYEFSPLRRAFMLDDNEVLKLTDKEIEILTYLNQAVGKVSREELLREVWRYNEGVTTHTLETHIYRLRQKLTQALGKDDLLITEEGGYSLKSD